MADEHVLAVIGICVAIFGFLAVMLGVGSYFGGSWIPVTNGVAKYIFVITCFGLGAYVLFYLVGRR